MTKHFKESDFWNERYKEESYAYGSHPNDFIKEHLSIFGTGSRILSLAEGEGRNAVFLAQKGHNVTGVDFSEEGRKKALKLASQNNVNIGYDICDLTSYDFKKNKWDAIISIFCHLTETHRNAIHQTIKHALKPGGIFILEAYNKEQLKYETGGPKDEKHLVACDELKAMFNNFEILLAEELEREIYEGDYHTGKASVTQFIARRPLR